MEVRGVRPRDDARGVASVHAASWRGAYEGIVAAAALREVAAAPDDEEVRRWVARLRENEDGILVAVDDEGAVRGFADVRWVEAETKAFVAADAAELKAIYVAPDCWGRGVGTALLDAAIDRLPDAVEALSLAVLAANEAGKGFYESRGFVRTGASEYDIAGESYPVDVYSLGL